MTSAQEVAPPNSCQKQLTPAWERVHSCWPGQQAFTLASCSCFHSGQTEVQTLRSWSSSHWWVDFSHCFSLKAVASKCWFHFTLLLSLGDQTQNVHNQVSQVPHNVSWQKGVWFCLLFSLPEWFMYPLILQLPWMQFPFDSHLKPGGASAGAVEH